MRRSPRASRSRGAVASAREPSRSRRPRKGSNIKHDIALPISGIAGLRGRDRRGAGAGAFRASAWSTSATSATATCTTTCRRPPAWRRPTSCATTSTRSTRWSTTRSSLRRLDLGRARHRRAEARRAGAAQVAGGAGADARRSRRRWTRRTDEPRAGARERAARDAAADALLQPVPSSAAGTGSGHHLDALVPQGLGLVAAGLAADAALAAPRRSGCGALRRRSARRRPRCASSRGARRASTAPAWSLGRRQGGARGRPCARAAAPGSAAARSAGAARPLAAQRALQQAALALRRSSSSDANQPSNRWSWAQRRLRTFMAASSAAATPLRLRAASASGQRPARQCCSHSRPTRVLASVSSPRSAPAPRARPALAVKTSRNSPASSVRSPSVRPRANQISMPSVE